MANQPNYMAALNTLTASRWTLFMARLFGKKVVGVDDWGGERCTVTGYQWRGKLYLTETIYVPSTRGVK